MDLDSASFGDSQVTPQLDLTKFGLGGLSVLFSLEWTGQMQED